MLLVWFALPGNFCVIVGTDRGFLAVYDLRFQLLVTAWRHSARAPIHSITAYIHEPLHGTTTERLRGQLSAVVATGENDVAAWNLETGECLRVLRALPERVTEGDARRAPYLRRVPTCGNELAALSATGKRLSTTSLSFSMAQTQSALAAAVGELADQQHGARYTNPVRAVLFPLAAASWDTPPATAGTGPGGLGFALGGVRGTGIGTPGAQLGGTAAGAAAGAAGRTVDGSTAVAVGAGKGLPVWLLTAGGDRHVRCWDLVRPRASRTVAGLEPGQATYVWHSLGLGLP